MAQPWKHPTTGNYYYRRAVPEALRSLLGKREWKHSLRTRDPAEAKRRYPAAAAECEAAFRAARAGRTPGQTHLSERDVAALAGEWLKRELSGREHDLGSDAEWDALADALRYAAEKKESDDGAAMLALVAAGVDELLKSERLEVDPACDSYRRLAEAIFWQTVTLSKVMRRRIDGDWGPVTALDRAPVWSGPRVDRNKTLLWALETWNAERKLPGKTADEYRKYVQAFGADRPIGSIRRTDVAEFKQQLLSGEKGSDPSTVWGKLSALRSILRWAKDSGYITENPASGIRVEGLKQKKRGPSSRKEYTRDDARTLLTAARKQTGTLRWLPWLLAATGGRLRECCQAYVSDVREEEGIPFLYITNEGENQSTKTPSSRRRVPLHPDLVAEGFLDYVRSLPPKGRLFPELKLGKYSDPGADAGRRYGRWARTMIDDPAKVAHSWRHSFKTWARDAEILEEISDALTGHKSADSVARRYGSKLLATLARAVAKIDFGAPSGS